MQIINKITLSALAFICAPMAASAQSASAGLETLIQCKPATKIAVQTAESQFLAIGLEKSADGFYFPANGKKAVFFGDEIIAAGVFSADGENKISVYLKNQTGQQLASRLRVTAIEENANTDEPSYVKQTSAKTTLLIGSAAELDTGKKTVPFRSSITCQVTR